MDTKTKDSNSSIKTPAAKKVLELMDSSEYGCDRYEEFVAVVAKEAGISIKDLNNQLEEFI